MAVAWIAARGLMRILPSRNQLQIGHGTHRRAQ